MGAPAFPPELLSVIAVDRWLLSLLDQQAGWWTVVSDGKICISKWLTVVDVARGRARGYGF